MELVNTQCCAIQEISGLSDYNDADEAMVAFCRQNFSGSVTFGTAVGARSTLYSFYLFTAAVYDEDDEYERGGYQYGSHFAKLIRDNNLGAVWASPVVRNLAFHDERSNQVWVWTPDTYALRAWWKTKKLELVHQSTSPGVQYCPVCAYNVDTSGYCSFCDDGED